MSSLNGERPECDPSPKNPLFALKEATVNNYDVLIVGYGPVGQMLCAQLAKAGHRVAAFEKYPQLYGMSRAGHVDDEIMRMIQSLGVHEEFQMDTAPWPLLEIRTGPFDGELLMSMDWSQPGAHGWAQHWHMFQNNLEMALDRFNRESGLVDVFFGTEVTGFDQNESGVTAEVTQSDGTAGTFTANYLVGADGANSLVRNSLGIDGDLLFDGTRQLVIDTVQKRPLSFEYDAGMFVSLPRPGFLMPMGRSHRRWEFSVLPHETAEDFADEAVIWELISPWVTPDDVELLRTPVYAFKDYLAHDWHSGRVFIAGDAAHSMWPYAAEGMCSGLRDASALAWRLDLALRSLAGPALFDSYAKERKPNVKAWIDISRIVGKLSVETDPDIAAANVAAMRQWRDSPSTAPAFPLPPLPAEFVRPGDPAGGAVFIQADVTSGTGTGRFDDLVGTGWVLLTTDASALELLDPEHQSFLEALGARTVVIGRDGLLSDASGAYKAWFEELGAVCVLSRPDFHLYGAAATGAELPNLVHSLMRQLSSTRTAVLDEDGFRDPILAS